MSISIIEVGSRFGTWYDRRASAHRERVVPHLDDATVRARLFLWGAGNVISARAASGGVRPNRPYYGCHCDSSSSGSDCHA